MSLCYSEDRLREVLFVLSDGALIAEEIARRIGSDNVRSLRKQLRAMSECGHIENGEPIRNPFPARNGPPRVMTWRLPTSDDTPHDVDMHPRSVTWVRAPNRDPVIRAAVESSFRWPPPMDDEQGYEVDAAGTFKG